MVARCSLCIVRCLLFVVWCLLLSVVCCQMWDVCCLLFVDRSLLLRCLPFFFAGCCMFVGCALAVRRSLFAVCRLAFFV